MRGTILLIDDNADARETTGALLRLYGYEVVLAANGEEGLARLHEVRPDLVLTDLRMPALDGEHLAARIRREATLSSIPIVLLTGVPPTAITRAAIFDACLQKPVSGHELFGVLRRLLPAA